jgi:hypothetical protein
VSSAGKVLVAMDIIPINCVDGSKFSVVVKTYCGRLILCGLPTYTAMAGDYFSCPICL